MTETHQAQTLKNKKINDTNFGLSQSQRNLFDADTCRISSKPPMYMYIT